MRRRRDASSVAAGRAGRPLLGLAALMLAGGCQSVEAPKPAVLADGTATTLAALQTALAEALGRSRVTLGADDPTKVARVVVLPPPLSPGETNSPARPVVFDLQRRGDVCFAVNRDTGVSQPLSGVTCIDAPPE